MLTVQFNVIYFCAAAYAINDLIMMLFCSQKHEFLKLYKHEFLKLVE